MWVEFCVPWFLLPTSPNKKWLRYRAGVAAGLAEIEKICLRNDRVLPQSEQDRLETAYVVYRSCSLHMCSWAIDGKKMRWRQRPKCHSLEHLVFDWRGTRMNPRFCSNYLDEDFVRRSKRLAVASNPKFVSKHVLFRYAIGVTLKWTNANVE